MSEITPPHGFRLPEDFSQWRQPEREAYFVESAAEHRRDLERLLISRERDSDRIDALIVESRRAISALAAAQSSGEELSDRLHSIESETLKIVSRMPALDSIAITVHRLSSALASLQQETISHRAALAETTMETGILRSSVTALNERVGVPPDKFEARISQIGQLTASELSDLERNGTGLFAAVAKNSAHISRIMSRVAIITVASTAAVPIVAEVIKFLVGH